MRVWSIDGLCFPGASASKRPFGESARGAGNVRRGGEKMSPMATTASSAGLLLYRERDGALQVLLGHMGGPFWARKDAGAWTIPKGELDAGEDPQAGARREFAEELGHDPPAGELLDLGEIRQRTGKRVRAFALRGDFDPAALRPGTFELEWPPRSGRRREFPELDRVGWFDVATAQAKVVAAQAALLERRAAALSAP
jgi:predicted NUDIX family NTP pyrophosphohydrolase